MRARRAPARGVERAPGPAPVKLAALRRFALSLPEAEERAHFEYGAFRVRGKIFVTVPPDAAHVHAFVPDAVREQALELHPEFVGKLWWGGKVVGLRVALASATPSVVRRLVRQAWEHKAPRSLRASAPKAEAGKARNP